MIRKLFAYAGLLASLLMFVALPALAQNEDPLPDATQQLPSDQLPVDQAPYEEPLQTDEIPPDQFYRGVITQIVGEEQTDTGMGQSISTQTLKVKFTTGDLKDQEREILNDGVFTINGGKPLKAGQQILIYRTAASGEEQFYVADTYRLPSLLIMIGAFFALAIVLSRWKGLASIVGLAISVLVIAKFIIPQIVDGKNPLLISLLGALIIALVSIYLAHGLNRRTTVALVSTLITLGLAAGLSILFVNFGHLFGMGSEEAFYVQQLGVLANLNLQGLLLGGIILGALGVLDDITTAQTATVDEIRRANPALGTSELFKRGLRVGREHINSLVNTLFLAYAGASLPLFLFFTVGGNGQPIWVTLNSEFIAEEVVRTLVGSMALMLAVPITTFLAAYYFGRRPVTPSDASVDGHAHIH
jgi:uncharacterized membrane protein